MQSINKTLILDLQQRTLTVIPNFFLQGWVLSKIQRIDTTLTINNLPEMRIVRYPRLKYDWTRRIYFRQGFWTVDLLELEKKETAQQVLNLLNR